ncbi:MAG: exodeoxyribonuclease VII large subunit [Aliiglaciecola sp.]
MFSQSSTSKNIYSVSQLNRMARSILESEIGQIWLSAEISNFVAASSGHWYFTLKDSRAQIKAAMFRGANMRVKMRPKEGDKILVRATVGIYEARGDYQLVVDFMEPEGEGQLKQQFEQLKIKLAAEGLFSTDHKLSLPSTIKTVGVVTSATGAALHDILTVLNRRSPNTSVIVYPSQVQGDTAASQIVEAIDKAIARREVDVLIVGRGGGSLEDLWCFNDETLARKLYHCPIPTVSAVGHEVDVTICDFVADVRAPTPSAAAELVSTDKQELMQMIDGLEKMLNQAMQTRLQIHQHALQIIDHKLAQTHPEIKIKQQLQIIDGLRLYISASFERKLAAYQKRFDNLQRRLVQKNPEQLIQRQQQQQQNLSAQLGKNLQNLLQKKQYQLAKASELLETVSPLSTLARGYSVTYKDKTIVKSIEDLQDGDVITTQLHDGQVNSKVQFNQSQ